MPAKKLTSNLYRPAVARLFSSRALAALALSGIALISWTADRLWPRHMHVSAQHRHLSPKIHGRNITLPFSNEVACAEIAAFDDQLEAFLRYEYLRGRDPDDASKIFLMAGAAANAANYKIYMLVENDQLTAIPRLNRMESHGLITHYELVAWTKQDFAFAQQQSRMFENAYNVPTEQKLETLAVVSTPSCARGFSRLQIADRLARRWAKARGRLSRSRITRLCGSLRTFLMSRIFTICRSIIFSESARWRTTTWM